MTDDARAFEAETDIPAALRRDANNVAPFMVTKPNTVDFFHETPRIVTGVSPEANPQATPPSWAPPWSSTFQPPDA